MRNVAAEFEPSLHRHAIALETLSEDLGENHRFGEVFRSDDDRTRTFCSAYITRYREDDKNTCECKSPDLTDERCPLADRVRLFELADREITDERQQRRRERTGE